MAVNLRSVLENPRQMGAALVLVGSSTTEEDLDTTMVLSWYLSEGVPFLSADEALDALEITEELLEQIEALMETNPDFVPEGYTSENWAFFRAALQDGVQAIAAELPDMEELDGAMGLFEEIYDTLVLTSKVQLPEPAVVDLSDEEEPEGQPESP